MVDNVDTADSLEMLLKELGHDVRKADDGSSSLEAAVDYCPHIMLLDIGLPGLDGYKLAIRIREQPALRDVVLVALTGYGDESARQRSLRAGFDHHMTKPADLGTLKQILAGISDSLVGEIVVARNADARRQLNK